ncbi:MAG: TonB-dependent copper receptor [Gammaproteobacteria bacterium]|jgi:iron complex outermembrane receptor protein|nr:TonB-dependent copper receptor [Gammaproteobacteria bacterium]MBT3488490.1 TonB-dependent copper receptor [Gammaproteobacteria bacterium]MBT3718184.1 TonB-dependent copper receptor [Gammaproteobacteria bacterium]MBT3844275.1 TonB-dependent copper receptor [Gammaproteobacteria bacterium]MBT3893023.1 TonB-dependent copper receptor [Gammaproteobacteria bacterium]
MKKSSISLAILFAIHGQIAAADGRVMAEILVEGSVLTASSKAMAGGPLDAEELSGLGATADGGELMSNISGISVRRIGGHGFDPVVRGQQQNRLNIVLDGAFVHAGCPNRMDPPSSYAALETYDKVTIIKGGQSVEHGAGAPGATVLFDRTTQPLAAGESQGKAGATYKDNGGFKKVYADGTIGFEQGYLRLGASMAEADNYEDGRGVEVRSGFKSKNGSVIVGFTTDNAQTLELGYEQNREDDVLFEGLGMDTVTTENGALRMKYHRVEGMDVELYSSEVDHDMDNYTLRTNNGMKMRHLTNSDTVGGKLSQQFKVGASDWSVGVDLKKQNRDSLLSAGMAGQASAATLFSYGWPDAHVDQVGLFAEAERPLNQQDALAYGVRLDRIDPSADKASLSVTHSMGGAATASANDAYTAINLNTAEAADTETNLSGFARFSRAVDADSELFVALSRSVRTADATERYINNRKANAGVNTAAWSWVGNPALDPEKHHQLEIGGEGVVNGVNWNSSLYYNNVSDYILKYKSATTTAYKNIDANLWGYELGAGRALSSDLTISADLAFVHATNDTESKAIGQIAPLNGSISLDYVMSEWDLGARLRFAAEQDRIDSDVDAGVTSGYGVVDLYATRLLQSDTELKFGVDNLFDKDYADHLNAESVLDGTSVQVNEPGRSLWVKANFRF